MTHRRSFLAGLLAAGTAPRLGWADAGSPAWLAAARDPSGAFALHGLAPTGVSLFRIPLPARGHAGARHPQRPLAVAFARRPGSYALVIDCVTGAVLHRLTPPPGRQFNGHGAFPGDGGILVTSEQMAYTSEGRLGLWRTGDFTRIGEIGTHGIGPHEVLALPDGVLAVANGGIATDPQDRTKLNVETMRPSLAFLDLSGELLEQVEVDGLAQNSIRHLAWGSDGTLAFAMQWEGDPGRVVPLLGLHRRGEGLRLAQAPDAEQARMKGYAGSVAVSDLGEAAISSPRGGRIHRFSRDGTFLGAVQRPDVCGLAPLPGGLLTSDGLGGLLAVEDGVPRLLARHDLAWDNHIVPV